MISTDIEQLTQHLDLAKQKKVAKPTLFYLNIHGVVWPIRCLLSIKGIDFEDVQIPIQTWGYRTEDGRQPLKEASPSLHIPVYSDQDVVITQSTTLMYYLAKKHGMLGQGAIEELQVMEVMAQCHDALFHWCGLLPIIGRVGIDPETFDQRMAAFMGEGRWGLVTSGHAINLHGLENYLKRNVSDSGYMVGNDLTFADLHAFNILCNWYKAFNPEAFMKYPILDDYIKRIGKMADIDRYIKSTKGMTTWLPIPKAGSNLTTTEELEGLLD